TGWPSSNTVQAPQVARSQTFFAPVKSSRLRSASRSVTRGPTLTFLDLPLILREIGVSPGPMILGFFVAASASGLTAVMTPAGAVPTPRPLRKPRRERLELG